MGLKLNNPLTSEVRQYLPYYKQMVINRKSTKDRTSVDQLKDAEQYMISMHGKLVKN